MLGWPPQKLRQSASSLLEAIVSRRPFSAITDVVAGSWTVDTICSLGLVQWQGVDGTPRPLVAPFILLLMLRQKLRAEGSISSPWATTSWKRALGRAIAGKTLSSSSPLFAQ